MSNETRKEQLAEIERHIALGERHLSRQREIVAELERDGHDATEAKRLLATFEDIQSTHLEDRERFRKLTQAS